MEIWFNVKERNKTRPKKKFPKFVFKSIFFRWYLWNKSFFLEFEREREVKLYQTEDRRWRERKQEEEREKRLWGEPEKKNHDGRKHEKTMQSAQKYVLYKSLDRFIKEQNTIGIQHKQQCTGSFALPLGFYYFDDLRDMRRDILDVLQGIFDFAKLLQCDMHSTYRVYKRLL